MLWHNQTSETTGRYITGRTGSCTHAEGQSGRNRPVALASKSLTPAETRYTNTECEMLAAIFGSMRFLHYLCGREFKYQSYHKPLEGIDLKHFINAPPRFQRLLLKIKPYNFVIKYIPSTDISMADALSRVSPNEETEIKGLDITILELTPQLSRIQVESIQKATQQDKTLQLLIQQISEGWPESCKKLPKIQRPFWKWRDDYPFNTHTPPGKVGSSYLSH